MVKRKLRTSYEECVKPHLECISKWRKLGATDEDIFNELGISKASYYKWKQEHKDFKDALKIGTKELVENIACDGIYKRALGYNYEEIKTYVDEKADGSITKKIEKTTKHLPPDVAACIFSLCNLAPDKFKNPKHEHKLGGDKDNPSKIELIFENDYGEP